MTSESGPAPRDRDPLSEGDRIALEVGRQELGVLLRPARLASVTAGTLFFCGAITVIWGAVAGGGGIITGIALLLVGWNERRGRDRLRALDPEGARILGWNQLVLAGVIAVYGVLAILRAGEPSDPSMQQLEELAGISPEVIADLTRKVYGAVIIAVTLVQSILARYYFRQQGRVEDFRRRTPAWVTRTLTELAPQSR